MARESSRLDGRDELFEDRRLLIGGLAISGGIVAGMFIGSTTLMMVAAVVALAAGLAFPALGLMVLALMAALQAPPVVPAPGFIAILVGMTLLGCVYRLPNSRTRVRVSGALLLLLGFVLYAFVQQLPEMTVGYAGERAHDVGYLFIQLLTGLGIIIAAGFVLRGRSPYPYFVALLLSATFAAVLGIVTAGGVPVDGLASLLSPVSEGERVSGPFGNPNNYGQLLAYAIVLGVGWFAITRSLPLRGGLIVTVTIMGIAMSLSLSRGAIATLLAGLVVFAFARSRALGVAAVAAALALVVVGYPLFVESRLVTETGSVSSAAVEGLDTSDEARLSAVLAGPELFATSPVFGIGFGQYKYQSAIVSDKGGGLVAHNWYGTVLAEQGLLGVVLWVGMLVAVGTWLRSRPARPRSIGLALFGAGVVGCLFLEPPTSFQTSIVVIVVVTAALVADWEGRSTVTGQESGGRRGHDHRRGDRRRHGETAGRRAGA